MYEAIKNSCPDAFKLLSEIIIIFLLVAYGYRPKISEIKLSEAQVDDIVEDFCPEGLVPEEFRDSDVGEIQCRYELADFDVFNLKNANKDAIKAVIRNYGVGTCGPRGFYGTLDLHLYLEREISKKFGTEDSILYPNSFTCINSVISCFCKAYDIVFYHRNASEAILRGISVTKSSTISFTNMDDLEKKIICYGNSKKRSFVVIEALCKNSGEIADMHRLLEIKSKFKLRLILDETYSFPILGRKGVSSYFGTNPRDVDIIIGSFAHYYASNGAFSTGMEYIVSYQRLNAKAYCFSASLPGFLAQHSLENMSKQLDQEKIYKLTHLFYERFRSQKFLITSPPNSPILIISSKSTKEEDNSNSHYKKVVLELSKIRKLLWKKSIRVSISKNPVPAIRIGLKASYKKSDVKAIVKKLEEVLDSSFNPED